MAQERAAAAWGVKLTVKTLGIDPRAVANTLENTKDKKPVARIYGRANDCRLQQDIDRGTSYLYFSGMFEGFNMITGDVKQSNRLYLPDGVAEMVEDVIRTAQDRDKKASIEFSVEIQVSKSEERDSGYEYHAHFIKKPGKSDELEILRKVSELKPEELRSAKPAHQKSA